MTRVHDVIVIGGGPAGAASAALLAGAGFDVLVLDRDAWPRFHIGESLLPGATAVLERLGVDMSGFLPKRGAEFFLERDGETQRAVFEFHEGLPGTPARTWQVERAAFDALLLERARAAGARVETGSRVVGAEIEREQVQVKVATAAGDERQTRRARYLIEASGQHTFLARRQRSLAPWSEFGRAAVFRHYTGLAPSARAELETTGSIKVVKLDGGWTWAIPLGAGRLSLGVVLREGPVTPELLDASVARSPLLSRLTAGAAAGEVRRIGDFSYLNLKSHGARFVCVGDAACFLDPVFSSGVTLALTGAGQAAALLGDALRGGREGEPELMAPLSAHMQRGYLTFAAFIHRFYATRMVENLFFMRDPDPDVRRGIVSVLAGDVWRDDNPFQTMLLDAARTGRRPLGWPPRAVAPAAGERPPE